MKRLHRQVIRVAVASLTVIASARAATNYVAPGESIQTAINAAKSGDTILVAAGTYNQTFNFGHKGIALIGAGAGKTILDGTGTTAALVSFSEVDDINNPLLFCGFTLTNAMGASSGNRFALDFNFARAGSRTVIQSNAFECAAAPATTYPCYIHNASAGGSIEVLDNTINDCANIAIFTEKAYGACEIARNTIRLAPAGGYAIYSSGYPQSDIGTNVTGRQWYHDNTIFAPGPGESRGVYARANSGTRFLDLDITGNVVTNMGSNGYGVYLRVQTLTSDLIDADVSHNVLSGAPGSTNNHGVYLLGPSHGTLVVSNRISGLNAGVRLVGVVIDSVARFPTNTLVTANDIAGNATWGILNEDTGGDVLAAQSNWWGHVSGPRDNKSLPGVPNYNNPTGQGDPVSSYVDYANWRNTPVFPPPRPPERALLILR